MINEINEETLGLLDDRIGDGGEGEVFRIPNMPGQVYKKFKKSVSADISEVGLIETIKILETFSSEDKKYIESRTVWPHTLVRRDSRVSGFIMPILGSEFFCLQGQAASPIETFSDWNKLSYRDITAANLNIYTSLPNLSEPSHRLELLKLLLDLTKIFSVLHKYGVVIGDVSGRNLVWTIEPEPRVVVIDCDGLRKAGTDAVTKAKQSPDWFDKHLVGPTTLDSDLYKLALAVFRAYFSATISYPDRPLTLGSMTDEDKALLEMAIRGTGQSARPSAMEWQLLLQRFLDTAAYKEMFGDRVVIDWHDGEVPVRRPITNPSVSYERPDIPWKQ
jgi:hypothetical protein